MGKHHKSDADKPNDEPKNGEVVAPVQKWIYTVLSDDLICKVGKVKKGETVSPQMFRGGQKDLDRFVEHKLVNREEEKKAE